MTPTPQHHSSTPAQHHHPAVPTQQHHTYHTKATFPSSRETLHRKPNPSNPHGLSDYDLAEELFGLKVWDYESVKRCRVGNPALEAGTRETYAGKRVMGVSRSERKRLQKVRKEVQDEMAARQRVDAERNRMEKMGRGLRQ